MNTPSYILGPLFLILGFAICLIIVVGIKATWLYLLERFKRKPIEKAPEPKKQPTKKQKTKSVEFDAQDIDRIYFRKSS